MSVRAEDTSGVPLPANINVSQPPLGTLATPLTVDVGPFEPFTASAPYSLNGCTFIGWFDPATGSVSRSRTLNGNTGTDQERVAQYVCHD